LAGTIISNASGSQQHIIQMSTAVITLFRSLITSLQREGNILFNTATVIADGAVGRAHRIKTQEHRRALYRLQRDITTTATVRTM
jgi:hypothetical protein